MPDGTNRLFRPMRQPALLHTRSRQAPTPCTPLGSSRVLLPYPLPQQRDRATWARMGPALSRYSGRPRPLASAPSEAELEWQALAAENWLDANRVSFCFE